MPNNVFLHYFVNTFFARAMTKMKLMVIFCLYNYNNNSVAASGGITDFHYIIVDDGGLED